MTLRRIWIFDLQWYNRNFVWVLISTSWPESLSISSILLRDANWLFVGCWLPSQKELLRSVNVQACGWFRLYQLCRANIGIMTTHLSLLQLQRPRLLGECNFLCCRRSSLSFEFSRFESNFWAITLSMTCALIRDWVAIPWWPVPVSWTNKNEFGSISVYRVLRE
jgi:hypothetical protein